jgi:excinuclease UvrABC nuclease subunit
MPAADATTRRRVDSVLLKIEAWAAFTRVSERALLSSLPTLPGVYIVLLPEAEARRKGASDIAYIGCAANQRGLRGRVRQYYHPGPTQRTSLAMRQRLCAHDCRLHLGFVITDTPAAAKRLESDLLIQFERDHGELPPYNRQRALASLA